MTFVFPLCCMVAPLLTVRHFSTPAIFPPWFSLYPPTDPPLYVTFTKFALTDFLRAVTFVVRAIILAFFVSSLEYQSEATILSNFAQAAVARSSCDILLFNPVLESISSLIRLIKELNLGFGPDRSAFNMYQQIDLQVLLLLKIFK